jgi:hypothetical protein
MASCKRVLRPSREESVSTAVVRGVAEIKGVDPTDLDERLYDHVDPDALDRLFRADPDGSVAAEVRVSFTMAGCRVDVRGPRTVVVMARSDPATALRGVA